MSDPDMERMRGVCFGCQKRECSDPQQVKITGTCKCYCHVKKGEPGVVTHARVVLASAEKALKKAIERHGPSHGAGKCFGGCPAVTVESDSYNAATTALDRLLKNRHNAAEDT